MNCPPSSSTASDGLEALPIVGSVLHEHPSETSGGSRDVADDVSSSAVCSETPAISSSCCIIDSLRKVSFSSRSFEDKKLIITNGRPMPKIDDLKTKTKSCFKHFRANIYYDKFKWLTACADSKKLYCWPCLIFNTDKNVWNSQGYSDISNFHRSAHRHEITQSHFISMTKLKTFGLTRIDLQIDDQLRADVLKHNALVKHNREILARLIAVTCFLGKNELSFRAHDESKESCNRGNYVDCLNLLSEYDEKLAQHMKTSTFTGLSKHIQNDLIDAIGEVLIEHIKSEIKSSPFVAIMLDESTDIACKSQLSTVMRYVTEDGKIQERFLGFIDVSAARTAEGLANIIFKCIDEYNIGSKLIGQTYDGAAVFAGHVRGLQARVKEKFPEAKFVHCYAHRLNLVLSQALCAIKVCKIFFQTISGFSSFFSKSSRRTNGLDEEVKKRFPKVAPTRWNYNSRLVHTIYDNKEALKDFFTHIRENPDNWDQETFNAVRGFLSELNDFNFNFMLTVFTELFPLTDTLFNILQKKSLDIAYCSSKVQEIKELVRNQRDKFNALWERIESNEEPFKKRARLSSTEDNRDVYRRVYYEIIDNISEQMESRFLDLKSLLFFELLDVNKRIAHRQMFPERAFTCLKDAYPRYFEFSRLRSELIAVFNIDDYATKSVSDLLKFLKQFQLDSDTFPEVYKLCTLISTLPATSASVERSFSAMKRIKTYCRNTQGQERLSALGLMSIEKELLMSLKQTSNFNDKVIDIFARKERRLELTYK